MVEVTTRHRLVLAMVANPWSRPESLLNGRRKAVTTFIGDRELGMKSFVLRVWPPAWGQRPLSWLFTAKRAG
jgi:hypothetical protein